MSIKKWTIATILVVMASTALAGFSSGGRSGGFSSGGGRGSFSSHSYSAPSKSFSTPSRSFSSPKAPSNSFSSPRYTSPSTVRTVPSYTYRTPSSVYRSPTIVHQYYGGGGYGGSILHNPFFWLWATQPHYYGAGMMMPNGVMAGPGGGYYTAPVVYSPLTTVFLWIMALGLIFLVVWLIVAVWRAIRD